MDLHLSVFLFYIDNLLVKLSVTRPCYARHTFVSRALHVCVSRVTRSCNDFFSRLFVYDC